MTMDRLNLRAAAGQETVSFEAARRPGIESDMVHLSVEPDDTLDAGYHEAFARLDPQSLGRLLYWLRTGIALPRDDERIPTPFTELVTIEGRAHVSEHVNNGARQSTASVITTWTPGTKLDQVEDTIKAGGRKAVVDVRKRFGAS